MPERRDAVPGALTGRRIGPFEVGELIGEGGMGEVYRARDTRLLRDVALKSVRSDRMARDPNLRRRFIHEMRLASRVDHPFVVSIHDVIEDEDTETPIMVMEFCKGPTLKELIRASSLSLEQAIRYAREICDALAAIHAARLVHQDLKPGNVIIEADHAKITDFGVARFVAGDSDTDRSEAPTVEVSKQGTILGTIPFMSPEQIRGEELDHRSDLFSLGTLLFLMLFKRHPFERATVLETSHAILHDDPADPTDSAPAGRTSEAGKIILKLLEKDPADRYASAREAEQALARIASPAEARSTLLPVSRRFLIWSTLSLAIISLAAAVWVNRSTIFSSIERAWIEKVQKKVVAILPFINETGNDVDEVAMLADLVTARASVVEGLHTVTSQRVAQVFEALGADAGRDKMLARASEHLVADWFLTGIVSRENEQIVVTAEIVDAGSRKTVDSYTTRSSDLYDLGIQVADWLGRVQGTRSSTDGDQDWSIAESTSQIAQVHYRRAVLLAQELRLDEAVKQVERALEEDENFLRARVSHARWLHDLGREREARDSITQARRRALRRNVPKDARIALELAFCDHIIHYRFEEAVAVSEQLVARFDNEPQLLMDLAWAQGRAKRFGEALETYYRALALDRLDPRIWLAKGRIETLLDERRTSAKASFEEADRLFELLGISRGHAGVVMALAYAAFREDQPTLAEERYAEAHRLFVQAGLPIQAAKAMKSRADMLAMLGRAAEAEPLYREAARAAKEAGAYNEYSRTLAGLGSCLWQLGDLEQAESYLRQAIDEARKLQNQDLTLIPLTNLTWMLSGTERIEEATRQAEALVLLSEERGNPLTASLAKLLLGQLARRAGRLTESETILEGIADELSRLDAHHIQRVDTLIFLAGLMESRGTPWSALQRSDEAVDVARRREATAELALAMAVRARIHARLGNAERARRDLDEIESMKASGVDPRGLADLVLLARQMLLALEQKWEELAGIDDGGMLPHRIWQAEALLHTGREMEARSVLEKGLALEETFADHRIAARVLLARAACLAAATAQSACRDAAERSYTAAREAGMLLETARSALMRAQAGDDEHRDTFLAAARTSVDRYLENLPANERPAAELFPPVREVLTFLDPR